MSKEQEVKSIIENILNPISGNTLSRENRIGDIALTNSSVTIVYNRDGIGPSEKKVIEKEMRQGLESLYEVDAITLKSISKESSDVYGASNDNCDSGSCGCSTDEKPAALQAGHSGLPDKRKVVGAKKVIAISSGKGGVGKSTVAANLALSLLHQGKKIGLIDADIYGPSIPMILGERDAKPRANEKEQIIPVEAYGIKFMSFGFFVDEKEPVIWRGPMLGGILNQFLFDVDWGELDYLIIDLPPGTGDMQLSLIQNTFVDGVVVVSTPQDVALLDSTKGLNMFTKVNIPIIGLVENMSSFICEHGTEYFIFGKDGVKNAAKELNYELLSSIPIEVELREGSDKGIPYMSVQSNEGKSVWKAFSNLAKNLDKALNK